MGDQITNTIRVTKEFNFDMAHALEGYNGKCKNIHGHSYHLSVTVKGKPVKDHNSPMDGMVIDFTDLKKIVKTNILDRFDHALVLRKDSQYKSLLGGSINDKIVLVPYQPTCENLLQDFVNRIKTKFDGDLELYCLKLQETATSYAQWFAYDNEGI